MVVIQSFVNLPPGVYLIAKLTLIIAMETPAGPLHPNTLAHELGHSLSLPHVDGSDSVLSPLTVGQAANRAPADSVTMRWSSTDWTEREAPQA